MAEKLRLPPSLYGQLPAQRSEPSLTQPSSHDGPPPLSGQRRLENAPSDLEVGDPGPASQGRTMMLPDSRRDPSCVQARAGAPARAPERAAASPAIVPVPGTSLLGIAHVASSMRQDIAEAELESAAPVLPEAPPESDRPPPRSAMRSRPWVEIPDAASSGIRPMPELEAAAPDLYIPPEPTSRRFGRGRWAAQGGAGGLAAPREAGSESLPDSPSGLRLARAERPSDVSQTLSRPPDVLATAEGRERAAFFATCAATLLILVGAGFWLLGSQPTLPAPNGSGATPTLEIAAPASVRVIAPAPATVLTLPPSDVAPKAPPSSQPSLQRKPRPQSAPLPNSPKSPHGIIDPWED